MAECTQEVQDAVGNQGRVMGSRFSTGCSSSGCVVSMKEWTLRCLLTLLSSPNCYHHLPGMALDGVVRENRQRRTFGVRAFLRGPDLTSDGSTIFPAQC